MERFAKTFFTFFIIFSFVLSSLYFILSSSPSSGGGEYGLSFRQASDGSLLLNTPHGPTPVWRLPSMVAAWSEPERAAYLSEAERIVLSRPSTADGMVNTILYLWREAWERMGKSVTVGFTDRPPYANCSTQSLPTIILLPGVNDTIQWEDYCITVFYTANSTLLDETGVLFYEGLGVYTR